MKINQKRLCFGCSPLYNWPRRYRNEGKQHVVVYPFVRWKLDGHNVGKRLSQYYRVQMQKHMPSIVSDHEKNINYRTPQQFVC
ncbi:hypothetical protein PLUTE_b1099 [Pseudoalteromonas luteoviolacea DSM 6061]|nr:hypothetical protein [Pseudoalteromonas luteoviolacea DSM 6061]